MWLLLGFAVFAGVIAFLGWRIVDTGMAEQEEIEEELQRLTETEIEPMLRGELAEWRPAP